MLHDIQSALSERNFHLLAAYVADYAAHERGYGTLSEKAARGALLTADYMDLIQYLSGGAIQEDPQIGIYRRHLLIERGYEKVGNFFKARLAEFNHIMPGCDLVKFSHNVIQERADRVSDLDEETAVKILREESGYRFFHGMMRPAYEEMAAIDSHIKLDSKKHIVIDYGSYSGDIAIFTAKRGHDVLCVQTQGSMSDAIEKRLKLRGLKARYLAMHEDDPAPELGVRSADVIAAYDALKNVADPLLLIEEFTLALKTGGYLLLGNSLEEPAEDGIITDSIGRRESIIHQVKKHFVESEYQGLFRKI